MAGGIDEDGMAENTSYFARAATSIQNQSHATSSLRPNEQAAHRPQNQPGLDQQNGGPNSSSVGVVQPKPQALPRRSGLAAIIVSPRQKGNPVLEKIKSMPWEWATETPADYILGTTTCALFLSLKYHRLHPEYIYTRIKGLQGKFALRIILCMVDIENHEQSLKELSKTSVINNVTVVLCWSAAEGARYLELFKTYENADPSSIKQHQSNAYSDRMTDFITTPRSINKTDAVSLVSQFGTIRTAVNARDEEVSTIGGWGDKKVQQWCRSVREPFRVKRAGKRGIDIDNLIAPSQPISQVPQTSLDAATATSDPSAVGTARSEGDIRPSSRSAEDLSTENSPEEVGGLSAPLMPSERPTAMSDEPAATKKRKTTEDSLNDGVMAALSKLRRT